MLDTEIQRPKYTMRLWIDDQGRHRIYLNGQQVADKQVWGSKAEHAFQHAADGRLINFKVILKVTGLTNMMSRDTRRHWPKGHNQRRRQSSHK